MRQGNAASNNKTTIWDRKFLSFNLIPWPIFNFLTVSSFWSHRFHSCSPFLQSSILWENSPKRFFIISKVIWMVLAPSPLTSRSIFANGREIVSLSLPLWAQPLLLYRVSNAEYECGAMCLSSDYSRSFAFLWVLNTQSSYRNAYGCLWMRSRRCTCFVFSEYYSSNDIHRMIFRPANYVNCC